MAITPGNLSTIRGQVTKYMYHRSALSYADKDKVICDESANRNIAGEIDGIAQASLNNLRNAVGMTYNSQVMTYNPKTDRFGIQNGNYVL